VRAAADVLRGFDTRLAGHLHVEKNEVGLVLPDGIDGLMPILCHRDDLDSSFASEHVLDALARERLVICDDHAKEGGSHIGLV
jgi:hypothetical protein